MMSLGSNEKEQFYLNLQDCLLKVKSLMETFSGYKLSFEMLEENFNLNINELI
jgi:hypothetical protein